MNDLFALRSNAAPKTSSWKLFFKDIDAWQERNAGKDVSYRKLADMLCYMGVSRSTPLSELESYQIEKLECIDCLYDLYFVSKPLLSDVSKAYADLLEEFSVYAYIEDTLIGVMTGFSTSCERIAEFYHEISGYMDHSICARSWLQLAKRAFPEIHHLVKENISEQMQERMVQRLQKHFSSGEACDRSCILVSDLYVDKDARRCGVMTHMLASLDIRFGLDYKAAFYLTPKKSSLLSSQPSLADMRMFADYDPAQYQVGLNVEIAKRMGMEIEGEERPIAILRVHAVA